MSKYFIESETLTSIADAIRTASGNTEQMTLAEMKSSLSELAPAKFPYKMNFENLNVAVDTNGVVYGEDMWVAGGVNADKYTSFDGLTWTKLSTNIVMGHTTRLCVNGMWINNDKNGKLYYSVDRCQTWEPCDLDTTAFITTVQYCNGHWYARDLNNEIMHHSLDGKVFEPLTLFSVAGTFKYINGTYIAHDPVNYKVWKSTDGINFEEMSGFPSGMIYGKTLTSHLGTLLCCDSRAQKYAYSADEGNTWTLLENSPVYSAIYNFKHQLIGYGGNNYYISNDGLNWNLIDSLSQKNINNLYVLDDIVLGVTTGKTIYWSLDLNTWYQGELPEGYTRCNGAFRGDNTLLLLVRDTNSKFSLIGTKIY